MVRRLMRLSKTMLTIGEEMDYYGGFGEMGQHGREMISASQLALDWARNMMPDSDRLNCEVTSKSQRRLTNGRKPALKGVNSSKSSNEQRSATADQGGSDVR